MPTSRARHVITETPDIAAAIDRAQSQFPQATRADALRHLVLVGAEAIGTEAIGRSELAERHGGQFAGVFPRGARQELLEEWPD